MLKESDLKVFRGQIEIVGQFPATGHYLAVDQATDQIGVLKILNEANPNVYNYLMKNPHKNLCAIYDYWTEDDRLYVFEEYLSGNTLEEKFESGGFSESTAIDILCQICDGLNVLHTANPVIIHKDLKFMNIMIDQNNCVKIIDFDISRTYRIGADHDTTTFGTRPYASPEHFGFGQTNEKSDQYAIGQMMKKMGMDYGRFSKIIKKTTQLDPNKRYRNVLELKYDIMGRTKTLLPLPGFRTGILWKEFLAVLGYIAIFSISFSMKSKGNEGELETWGNRMTVFFVMLTEVDLLTKWTSFFRRIPFLYDSRTLVRILAHILIGVIVLFTWALIEAMVLNPFK